jgi:hypothetical protein
MNEDLDLGGIAGTCESRKAGVASYHSYFPANSLVLGDLLLGEHVALALRFECGLLDDVSLTLELGV